MSGSLARGDGENDPGACATRDFTNLIRGPWRERPVRRQVRRVLWAIALRVRRTYPEIWWPSRDRLILHVGIPIPGKDFLYIETGLARLQSPDLMVTSRHGITGPLRGNPPVDSPHKGSGMKRFDDQVVEQTVELPFIWDAMTPMWRHCDVHSTRHPFGFLFHITDSQYLEV